MSDNRDLIIIGSVLLLGGAWWYSRQVMQASSDTADYLASDSESDTSITDYVSGVAEDMWNGTLESLDSWSGGLVRTSAMRGVDGSILGNRNVQAMLRVIRTGEGTADAGGYNRLFGGGSFSNMSDHPRQKITKWGLTSTAAGAYQMKSDTWDETRAAMKLPDFSPRSQDLAALGRIAARGALRDVVAGNFQTAVRKLNKEWASLPESPYGQGTLSWAKARAVFADAGGSDVMVG